MAVGDKRVGNGIWVATSLSLLSFGGVGAARESFVAAAAAAAESSSSELPSSESSSSSDPRSWNLGDLTDTGVDGPADALAARLAVSNFAGNANRPLCGGGGCCGCSWAA